MSNQTISEAAIKELALSLFHTVYGKGDAGSKFAFHAQNPCWIEGWWKLAKRFIDAAARVEPTDKDLWTVRPIYEGQNIVTANLFIAGINYQFDGRYFDTIRELAIAHNASLPATPTPQGQTSEQTGGAMWTYERDNFEEQITRHFWTIIEGEKEIGTAVTEFGAIKICRAHNASLGAATDKGERFS